MAECSRSLSKGYPSARTPLVANHGFGEQQIECVVEGRKVRMCQSLPPRPQRKTLLRRLITRYENWVLCGHPTRHKSWLQRGEPLLKKTKVRELDEEKILQVLFMGFRRNAAQVPIAS